MTADDTTVWDPTSSGHRVVAAVKPGIASYSSISALASEYERRANAEGRCAQTDLNDYPSSASRDKK